MMLDNAKKLPDKDLEDVSGGFIVFTGGNSPDHPHRFEVVDDKGATLQTFDCKNLSRV